MGIINILNSEISNKIAAGEVVERPASVVKELVENSIDAGSSNITVEIKNGGALYIRVTDDGSGMSAEDAKICFLRHATSKIQTDADLDAIYTLGFRGEALSSIGAVANVTLKTKRGEDEYGICVKCDGGEITSSADTGTPDGTDITVENLFYNTPARQKFLKKDATEAGYITDIVTRFILAHPEISFRLTVNGREKLYSAGDNSLLNAVYSVYGKDYARHMRPVSYEEDGVSVIGLCGVGTAARPNRNYQSFFVNGRYIKSPMITRAVEEAYTNQIMIGKHPAAVLNIKINPAFTDINVHPTKLEVKFSNDKNIYHVVFSAVRNALFAEANVPKIERDALNGERSNGKDEASGISEKDGDNRLYLSDMAKELPKNTGGFGFRRGADTARAKQGRVPEDYSGIVRADNAAAYGDAFANAYKPKTKGLYVEDSVRRGSILDDEPAVYRNTADTVTAADNGNAANGVSAEDTGAEEVDENVFVDEYFKIIGQVFGTYIIAEKGNEMLIVDQHAAHERLKFEELKRHIENNEPFSQMLIEPVIFRVGAEEFDAFCENRAEFEKMGFDCDEYGENTLIVRAVPGEVDMGDVEDLVIELLDLAASMKKNLITDTQMRLLETIACKSAVKANMNLSVGEMEELLRNVLRMRKINTCPHGRPIVITMSKKELEKEFGRIM